MSEGWLESLFCTFSLQHIFVYQSALIGVECGGKEVSGLLHLHLRSLPVRWLLNFVMRGAPRNCLLSPNRVVAAARGRWPPTLFSSKVSEHHR